VPTLVLVGGLDLDDIPCHGWSCDRPDSPGASHRLARHCAHCCQWNAPQTSSRCYATCQPAGVHRTSRSPRVCLSSAGLPGAAETLEGNMRPGSRPANGPGSSQLSRCPAKTPARPALARRRGTDAPVAICPSWTWRTRARGIIPCAVDRRSRLRGQAVARAQSVPGLAVRRVRCRWSRTPDETQ